VSEDKPFWPDSLRYFWLGFSCLISSVFFTVIVAALCWFLIGHRTAIIVSFVIFCIMQGVGLEAYANAEFPRRLLELESPGTPLAMSGRISKLKNVLRAVGVLVLVYVGLWIFGEHGHTYYLDPAKKVGTGWSCSSGEDGPFWDNGKDSGPVCHDPVRQCPVLWLPLAVQVPCPYNLNPA
jgi:hypothetical protein